MHSYFFIPGRYPELSILELKSVLDIFARKYTVETNSESYFVISSEIEPESMSDLYNRLGGMIKFGEILSDQFQIKDLIKKDKTLFGVSAYSQNIQNRDLSNFVKNYSKNLKKEISKEFGRTRFIGGRSASLSAGQIIGTKLLDNGFEIVLLEDSHGEVKTGKTLAVQDIEEFTKRDFEKPYADVEMGVMPPKLARIMINLAGLREGDVVWDPFCGSGNILMEGLILHFDMLGSDIDNDAVKASHANIQWLSDNYDLGESKYNVMEIDISKLDEGTHKRLRKSNIKALIFEPYMGPPMKKPISKQFAMEQIEMVSELYRNILEIASHLRTPNIKIVSIFPSYKTREGWVTARYSEIFDKGWDLSFNSKHQGLHWDRTNSIIRRNLVIAQYKD